MFVFFIENLPSILLLAVLTAKRVSYSKAFVFEGDKGSVLHLPGTHSALYSAMLSLTVPIQGSWYGETFIAGKSRFQRIVNSSTEIDSGNLKTGCQRTL